MTAGSPGNSGQEGSSNGAPKQRVPKPKWLRVKLPTGEAYREVRNIVSEHKLHTICESGHCPNMGECWGEGTATFMILGNICTRSCGFCNVVTGKPEEVASVIAFLLSDQANWINGIDIIIDGGMGAFALAAG